jgi:hypothetical protein
LDTSYVVVPALPVTLELNELIESEQGDGGSGGSGLGGDVAQYCT